VIKRSSPASWTGLEAYRARVDPEAGRCQAVARTLASDAQNPGEPACRLAYLDSEQEAKIYIRLFFGFGPVFGQSWAQERAPRPRLEKRCVNHTWFYFRR
jgi:hypothetical protein